MKFLASIAVICVIIGTCTLASCQKIVADLVVYGKIFTAEENRIAEAFAVKNGKYIINADYIVLMEIGEEQPIESDIPWKNTDDMS